jgi:hypothetical protein
MKETKTPLGGFRICKKPVVKTHPAVEQPLAETSGAPGELPSSYGKDLLYIIARDPRSLFLYWDLDWTQAFADAGVSAQPVHLRVFRADGSIEATTEINPLAGHLYADVSAPGTQYYCELGFFDGDEWKNLARSGTMTTPDAGMSEDLSAAFATLPLHLSFQRLLETFEGKATDDPSAESEVRSWTKGFRSWAANRKVFLSAESWIEPELRGASDLAWLLASTEDDDAQSSLTPEMLEQWKQLGERFGGSSWGGASSSAFGQGSRA